MASVRDEYGRFMQWLRTADASDDAKRVAQIVLRHLGELVDTSSSGGQRARILVPLLRSEIGDANPVIAAETAAATTVLPWTQLEKLVIGPFRGFRREEQFDLGKRVVLVYGPNGSGKTSLCEAIEYALVGDVEEASLRRVESLEHYFDNFHEGRHVPPSLWSTGAAGGTLVIANKEILRFAIIEKNRIEGFARLAARTPAQASALIATLFGLDAFNDFVNNFTNSIERQLQLETPRAEELFLKQNDLNNAQARILANEIVLRSFDEEEERICTTVGCSREQLSNVLGLRERTGRLFELTTQLEAPLRAKSNITRVGAVNLCRSLRRSLTSLSQASQQLTERSAQISFRDLYRAVSALEGDSIDVCPACETPLEEVTRNPFERAVGGLRLLEDLAVLEEERNVLLKNCESLSSQLRTLAATAHGLSLLDRDVFSELVEWLDAREPAPIWTLCSIDGPVWRDLLRAAKSLEASDLNIQQTIEQRGYLQSERERLAAAKDALIALGGRREQNVVQLQQERELVEGFAANNATLLQASLNESGWVSGELRIKQAYGDYLELIQRYRDQLPETLLSDLNETTRDLFNQFNADDHDNDKLSRIALPLRGGERIDVAFKGTPDTMRDALQTLSEGHLRCLGLAILLAKNVQLGLPIIVFDDAVNAIDHDHRAGIRSTLFSDSRFQSKQIVMTSHSNEFIKDIQNQLGEGLSQLYVLDHHAGDHHPRVQNGNTRRYLTCAKDRLADGNPRQCLAFCRQALENLTARIWKALKKKSTDLSTLQLTLRAGSEKPELRELTVALEKNIALGRKQGILSGDAWEKRHSGLAQILSIPERHIAWQYLNKGTHDEEDREDFEIPVVKGVVVALETVAATLST